MWRDRASGVGAYEPGSLLGSAFQRGPVRYRLMRLAKLGQALVERESEGFEMLARRASSP